MDFFKIILGRFSDFPDFKNLVISMLPQAEFAALIEQLQRNSACGLNLTLIDKFYHVADAWFWM